MPTPIWSYRVAPQHRGVMKKVADALRRDPALAPALEAAIAATSDPARGAIGPFRDEDAAIAFIRDRLVVSLDPESVWLFGSRARGDRRADSDFDVLVVLADERGNEAHDYRYVREPLLGAGLPLDVVPCAQSEFDRAKGEPGTIIHAAVSEGRCLYRRRPRRKAPAR